MDVPVSFVRQASIVISLLLVVPIKAQPHILDHQSGIATIGHEPFRDRNVLGGTFIEVTVVNPPGIGAEFETSGIGFGSEGCSKDNTDAAKGKSIAERKGTYWTLTGDTTPDRAGALSTEYILDGSKIRLGSGDAKKAAAEVSADLLTWDPWTNMADNEYNIEDNKCNPWKVTKPTKNGAAASIVFFPQITAPLPLEGVSDLFAKIVKNEGSALLKPRLEPPRNFVHVTKDFFQSRPQGIDPNNVEEDVLGFFSLILAYCRNTFTGNRTPKNIVSIMSRTEFSTIYKLVKAKIPGDLYEIVKVVACYQIDERGISIDKDYCSGTPEDPKPNQQMDANEFSFRAEKLKVKDWIEGIQNGVSPDGLSKMDKQEDGSLGGFGTTMESVLDTDRPVPIFEFRNLDALTIGKVAELVDLAEQEIIGYHKAASDKDRSRHAFVKP
ncbi:MAG: hypothetical protein M1831_002124 [Alyxoria varia]|nr:MAG: hypothetical protein M1831_002124 [Alyxoria varia]